jgi:hypothetical protein
MASRHDPIEKRGKPPMGHLAFYNHGCEPASGPAGFMVLIRRALRRTLLPMFRRLEDLLRSICHRLEAAEHEAKDLRNLVEDLRHRQEEQAAKLPSTLAFGWDYVAMVRRLAVLEEHVDTLLNEKKAAEASARVGSIHHQ